MDGDEIRLEHADGWAAYERIETFLVADGWSPEQIEGMTAFSARFVGKNGEYRVVTHVNIELEQLYCYACPAFLVPEHRRSAVAEYLTRANYGLRIGNFELDMRDGETRYKSSLDFEGAGLSDQLIRTTLYPAVGTLDRYYPGLVKVAEDGADPAEIIASIETDRG